MATAVSFDPLCTNHKTAASRTRAHIVQTVGQHSSWFLDSHLTFWFLFGDGGQGSGSGSHKESKLHFVRTAEGNAGDLLGRGFQNPPPLGFPPLQPQK